MNINLTIDRFENEKAVLKTKDNESIIWPKNKLPENLKEGDVIGKEGKATLEMNVKGFKKAFKAQGDDSQEVTTNAKFEDGTWTVVFKRPLFTEDKKHDVTGSMKGKISEILSMGVDVYVLNGLKKGNLLRSLKGENVGTRIFGKV